MKDDTECNSKDKNGWSGLIWFSIFLVFMFSIIPIFLYLVSLTKPLTE